ncbi:cobyric acid synthase [Natroniella acetigena]|uniref:cobyric acid synthase n=1 Tax=Natroniella acetigena TaxID=52004 RepID=UPI00200A4A37|nr:cobyric acid synthase [Natroniella acetigena]MCK8826479.1 cobyric acid synthase [Natroniella acetigena]
MTGRAIMFQGTGSDVGKSVLTAAICRILVQDGYSVAPFKSQNMALNSYITKAGGEIGRAQAVQAEAAKVDATIDMNPILLKPKEDTSSQVIIHGQASRNMTAQEYFSSQQVGLQAIEESLERLKDEYQIVVLEGAGSPAEVNLRDYDLVNMRIARLAKAPVILVADIDRGGVFASIIGTFELLNEEEREQIEGIIINKFRGEVSRLQSGIDYVEKETGVPVLGVLPYFEDFKVPEEDSIPSSVQGAEDYQLEIVVIRLPHISNFTDFDALAKEPGTRVRYVEYKEELGEPDLIIIPGSKNTIEDLEDLYQTDFATEIIKKAEGGVPIVGICGGYQMLGRVLYDPAEVETERGQIEGLGLLDLETTLATDKITSQVRARVTGDNGFWGQLEEGAVTGYEIHMGRTELGVDSQPLLEITERSEREVSVADGACSSDGLVWGTYLHGIFDNDHLRRQLINFLRSNKGLTPLEDEVIEINSEREEAYEKLAAGVRENLDMEKLYEILF